MSPVDALLNPCQSIRSLWQFSGPVDPLHQAGKDIVLDHSASVCDMGEEVRCHLRTERVRELSAHFAIPSGEELKRARFGSSQGIDSLRVILNDRSPQLPDPIFECRSDRSVPHRQVQLPGVPQKRASFLTELSDRAVHRKRVPRIGFAEHDERLQKP